jgi:hypothetical protein
MELDRRHRKSQPLDESDESEGPTSEERREAIIAARKKQLEEEMEAMKNADTDEDIDDGEYRNPFEEDDNPYDDEYDYDTDEEEREAEELKECTFKPNINKTNIPARTVDDLIEWGKQKHHRMLETKIKINCFDPNDYNPKVNKKSKKMVGKRKGRIEDRLLNLGKEQRKNLKKKRKEATAGMFNPVISNKSKKIVERKQTRQPDHLKKHLTGQSGRTDYFRTVPGERPEQITPTSSVDYESQQKKTKADPM